MAGDPPVAWKTCSDGDCLGVRITGVDWCLVHAAVQDVNEELKRIASEGTVDARGVQLSAALLGRIIEAAPREKGRLALRAAQFEKAVFQGDAGFGRAIFKGKASFGGATFEGDARFGGAEFEHEIWFSGAAFLGRTTDFDRATFAGQASFEGATFRAMAGFLGATFQRQVRFTGASFEGDAWFSHATFQDVAWFEKAIFQGMVGFNGATFEDMAWFARATFQGDSWFERATFQRVAGFKEATFERARQIGPLLARKLVLDDAVFSERVRLEAAAAALCRRAKFPAGARIRLRWASVVLDDADLAAPASLAGVPPFPDLDEQDAARRWHRLPPGPPAQRWRPRLLSLCRADVAGLRVNNVDLQACRFNGAHNLDKLRIEGEPLFGRTRGWWRARRRTLAEEQQWRARRPGRWQPGGWYPRTCQPPASPEAEQPEALAPVQLAALYRDLRKGREDVKDEPGAADFYYGEMEMRRRDKSSPRAERLVLWLYWLVSGYALRAWRAMATLAMVVLLAAVGFAFWGFPQSEPGFRTVGIVRSGAPVYQQRPADPPPGVERLPAAIRFSARSATALLRGPDRALTPLGEWLEIALRFLGPILLGLALLSVRGRVRR